MKNISKNFKITIKIIDYLFFFFFFCLLFFICVLLLFYSNLLKKPNISFNFFRYFTFNFTVITKCFGDFVIFTLKYKTKAYGCGRVMKLKCFQNEIAPINQTS